MRSRNEEEKRESRRGSNVNLTARIWLMTFLLGQEKNERRDIIFRIIIFLGTWLLASGFFRWFSVTNGKRENSWVEILGGLLRVSGRPTSEVSGER